MREGRLAALHIYNISIHAVTWIIDLLLKYTSAPSSLINTYKTHANETSSESRGRKALKKYKRDGVSASREPGKQNESTKKESSI